MHDQGAHLYPVRVLPYAAIDADNTPSAIDLLGFHAATLILDIGVGGITFTGTNRVDFTLSHSDDDSTYTEVALKDVEGVASSLITSDELTTAGVIKSLIAAHAAAALYKYRYVGGKRYLKLLANFGGTHSSATPMGAILIKGHPDVSAARATN